MFLIIVSRSAVESLAACLHMDLKALRSLLRVESPPGSFPWFAPVSADVRKRLFHLLMHKDMFKEYSINSILLNTHWVEHNSIAWSHRFDPHSSAVLVSLQACFNPVEAIFT
jgi:hypothetical protein